MTPRDLQALRTAYPASLADRTDDYCQAWATILCELGGDLSSALPATEPPPFVVAADGAVAVRESVAVRAAWRTGAALTGQISPHVRGVS